MEDFSETTAETPRYYFGTDPPQVEQDPSYTSYVLVTYAHLDIDDVLLFEPSGDVAGFFGGVQAGYNWQSGSAVFGVDASLSASAISGDASFENVYTGDVDVTVEGAFEVDLNWLAMLRGRAGFATGNVLPYVAGGVAIGQADIDGWVEVSAPDTTKTPVGASSSTQLGLTAAVGTEVAVSDDISLFGELGYVAFAPFEVDIGDGANFAFDLSSVLVRAGVNFQF